MTTFVITDESELMSVQRKIIEEMDRVGRDDPFYLINVNRIVDKYREWTEHLPRIRPYYAIKCNSHRAVVQSLTQLGCGLDVATKKEIKRALSLGLSPSSLVYSNTCKSISNLKYAKKVGVGLTVFDSECELHKIQSYYPSAELLIRLRFDDPNAEINMGHHFGCSRDEGEKLLKLAYQMDLNVIGVSFHVGCGSRDPNIYAKAIAEAEKLFAFSGKLGKPMKLLNIGGGFPGSLGGLDIPFSRYAQAINGAFQTYFPPSAGVQIIAEPGQYFAANVQSVFVNIIGIKHDTIGRRAYILSDGMHGSFRDVVTFKLQPDISIPPWYDLDDLPHEECNLWGPTCDPMDLISESCTLPPMQVGQWLEFRRMGAYTNELFCNFNGFPKPKCFSIVTPELLHLIS